MLQHVGSSLTIEFNASLQAAKLLRGGKCKIFFRRKAADTIGAFSFTQKISRFDGGFAEGIGKKFLVFVKSPAEQNYNLAFESEAVSALKKRCGKFHTEFDRCVELSDRFHEFEKA